MTSAESERRETLAKRLCKELSERSSQTFVPQKIDWGSFWTCTNSHRDRAYFSSHRKELEGRFFEYPAKSPDGRELGLMYLFGDLDTVCFDSDPRRLVKWPDDWMDPYPASIESVRITDEYAVIKKGGDMELDFMCMTYYATEFDVNMSFLSFEIHPGIPLDDILTRVLRSKENRMKVSRFIPAAVKDINIFLRMLEEILVKYGLDSPEARPRIRHFDCYVLFKIDGMSDESIIDGVLRRVEAMTELRRRFRETMLDERRRVYYESTILFPEDPFRRRFRIPSLPVKDFSFRKYEGARRLCKWPPNVDPEMDESYERRLKEDLWDSESFKYYDFDGQRLRLAKRTRTGLRFLGRVDKKGWIKIDKRRVKEDDLKREDIVIAADERLEKLPKFPLEKIEFLKEDFPEMFK